MTSTLTVAGTQAADWLTSRVDVFAKDWVTGTVGSGFEAYARIFHPLDAGSESPGWAAVAAEHGRTMHAGAEWDRINSTPTTFATSTGRGFPGEPYFGNLEAHALATLCRILADHTSTSDECLFAVWEGWGWMYPGGTSALPSVQIGHRREPTRHAATERQLDLTGPTFAIPGRNYYLFSGPIGAALQIGHWATADWFIPQSPSFCWPADHSWCVGTEIDNDSTIVGGSRALVNALVGASDLEALPIAPDASRWDSVNL